MNFLKILDFELFIHAKNKNLKLIILDNYLQYLLKNHNQNNYLQWFFFKVLFLRIKLWLIVYRRKYVDSLD